MQTLEILYGGDHGWSLLVAAVCKDEPLHSMHGTQFQKTFRIQVIYLWLLLHPQLSLYSPI